MTLRNEKKLRAQIRLARSLENQLGDGLFHPPEKFARTHENSSSLIYRHHDSLKIQKNPSKIRSIKQFIGQHGI